MGCTNVLASPRNKSIDASIRFAGAPPGGAPPLCFQAHSTYRAGFVSKSPVRGSLPPDSSRIVIAPFTAWLADPILTAVHNDCLTDSAEPRG
jgi:hypothetical protein